MDLAITPPLTKMGQLFWRVLTETGQALRWAVTKVGQAVSWVNFKPSDPSQDTDAITGGDVAGKSQSQESPVSSYTHGYSKDIPVDNDDEHRVVSLREPLLSEDEANAAYVVCDFPTPPVTVPEVPTKHRLETALGSPVGKDEAKITDVVTKSSMLPTAVPEEPPNSSYRLVVKRVSPVMVGSLSTLSEPKPPRFGRIGRYDGGQRILLVGEGDFSFSACLAAAFGDASNMVATSLDNFDFLKKNYKRAPENIKELKRRGCEVIHRVDATKMANHPRLCSIQFDCIIYNFPFRGSSIRNAPCEVQTSYHQSLVLGFMTNAKEMIGDDGEIHITHKSNGLSKEWNIVELGTSAGLELVGAEQFKLQKYPGYRTKYGFGGDKDFNWRPSKTYKFKLAPKKKSRRKRKN